MLYREMNESAHTRQEISVKDREGSRRAESSLGPTKKKSFLGENFFIFHA